MVARDPSPAEMAMLGGAWPGFAERWLGESLTYPAGRGQDKPLRGWTCGCGRGFSPAIRECPYCPEDKPPAFIAKQDVMGDWGDET